jgi:hypothetical protein
MSIEEPDSDLYGDLELRDSGVRLAVHYTMRQEEGREIGYLRLAFGQGNFINRVLGSVGQLGHLITATGIRYQVRITSSDPTSVPGYLCVFTRSNANGVE